MSEIGEKQVTLAGEALKDEYFTHVYSSDLKRAYNVSLYHIMSVFMSYNSTIIYQQ